MSETNHPARHPSRRRVSTLARVLAADLLLDATGLDRDTITAVVDGAAYLIEAGNTDGAGTLVTLAAGDAATAASALAALGTPAPDPTGALAGTPAWAAATHVQVLPLDRAREDPGGPVVGVYSPLPVIHPPHWCDHLESVCAGCLSAWNDDHALALFDHGPHGPAHGCRCPTCHPATPTAGPDTPNPGTSPEAPGGGEGEGQ